MKLSETPEEQRDGHIAYVNQRWEQLSKLEIKWGEESVKYLLFVNSGAAAAVLAFIGTSPLIRALLWPKIMLGSFVLGIVILGVYHAVRYHRIAYIYRGWRENVDRYYRDKLDWEEMLKQDDKRAYAAIIPQISLAYLSFTCFLTGVAVGLCNFSHLVN